eukprot:TRINITY_DN2669_c0_g1_i17.p1 TRINITY_DN2669_c0_g1~~TRINITY_DN2669_c0_g1_i17.p1  ORF type:complete len:112 (+),score=15.07 TRINITY_DN2669_c0_g1_i17:104-439(+)
MQQGESTIRCEEAVVSTQSTGTEMNSERRTPRPSYIDTNILLLTHCLQCDKETEEMKTIWQAMRNLRYRYIKLQKMVMGDRSTEGDPKQAKPNKKRKHKTPPPPPSDESIS